MLEARRRSHREVRVFAKSPMLIMHNAYAVRFLDFKDQKLHAAKGKGLNTSPVFHNRCNSTAIFLATATIALFVAFLPPVYDLRKPHWRSAESLPWWPNA